MSTRPPSHFDPTADARGGSVTLDRLANGQEGIVAGLQARAGMTAELLRRLTEIGFIPGERVRVLARGLFGGPPLAVRVGTSTFALRRMEAQSIDVIPERSAS